MVSELQILPDDLQKNLQILLQSSEVLLTVSSLFSSVIFMFYINLILLGVKVMNAMVGLLKSVLSLNLPDKTCSTNRWQIRRNIKVIVSEPTRHNSIIRFSNRILR